MINTQDKIYDILIVGGGAAGLFLAANLRSKSVAILEKNANFGKKILASGGGRCNITNKFINANKYLGDYEFIKNATENLSHKDVLNFFSELKFSEEKNNQFFCKSSSKDVLNALLKRLNHCDKFTSCDVTNITKNGDLFKIQTNNLNFKAKNVVIASGGMSYKALGASDVGYKIAQSFGHSVQKPLPALVGFSVQKDEFWFKNLSGVSFFAKANIASKELSGDLLFTHKGISGPLILNCSLFWEKGQIVLDFLPDFKIDKFKNSQKQLSTILPTPKRFTKEFLLSQELADKPVNKYNNLEMQTIKKLEAYSFAPAGNFGFERAEITKGGVKTDELTSNFQSKNIDGLFFIGEVLDVSGMLGGFNIHFAFASAFTLSTYLNKGY
ncbi:flavoprotein, HI0933 family [Campylobacter iguaniorum]|uniref:Flavoprotein, HI0933 family n=1 Tax=Campylobacter iguaniorum TaxID=1244531 RepID=A0A076FF59_9BACT|nr:aminoacetone oxidase family FAD-binding enzyme [Campylobacter iguaniorum]AII14474.1 flavoprotein, HI0933 family [Campylobacter iguaniorum]